MHLIDLIFNRVLRLGCLAIGIALALGVAIGLILSH